MKPSKSGELNKADYKNLAINAGLLALGAIVTYLLEQIPTMDFGSNTVMVQATVTLLLKAVQYYLRGK